MWNSSAVTPAQARRVSLFTVAVLLFSVGCASTSTHNAGRTTLALTQAECNQSDSTVSCCLKRHPYEPERCGVEAPTRPPQPIRLPSPGTTDSASADELPSPDERERWRRDICEPRYAKCIGKGGDSVPGRVYNETQCKACYDYCTRKGFWPHSANGKRCPGG